MDHRYLTKYSRKSPLIQGVPSPDLVLVVVIPAYDEDDLLPCLFSLMSADRPAGCCAEILVIINYPEGAESMVAEKSHLQFTQIREIAVTYSSSDFLLYVHLEVLPKAEAGVGLARKIGMDEAVRRFEALSRDGIIVNLDADCTVEKNYFAAIISHFRKRPDKWAAGLYFEHPIRDSQDPIIFYELHLRYFIEAQRYVGLPFAYQTVGSCMAVRSSAYQKMGGMNVRQAGEDFYFLHKFIAVNRFFEINTTTIYPSPRASFRVPFGTGKAIKAQLEGTPQTTYHFAPFLEIMWMISLLPDAYQRTHVREWLIQLPKVMQWYFIEINGQEKMLEIKRETASYKTFVNRFYQWFNAFRLMKFLHFSRQYFPDRPVMEQATEFQREGDSSAKIHHPVELLDWYRQRAKHWKV